MESDKKIGITSSKILYFYEDNIIHNMQNFPINYSRGITGIKKKIRFN
jgi:hypothetical protein